MPFLPLVFLVLALALMQAGIGGAKLLYSLPAYALVGLAAISTIALPARKLSPHIRGVCLVSVLLMGAYICGRAWFSPVVYLARTDLFMAVGAVLVYLLSSVFLPRVPQRIALLISLFVMVMAQVVIGAVQFNEAENWMLFEPWIIRTDYDWRASGFFICPNHLAGLLEMLGMFAVALTLWARWSALGRFFSGYIALMCFVGVALTGSRGGYVSVMAGLAVVAFLSLWVLRRMDRKQFALALILTLTGAAVLIGGGIMIMSSSDVIRARIDGVYDPQNMRLYLWAAALKQWALDPVWGTGSGTYLYFGRELRSALVQNDPIHVHNDYLHLLAEYGIAGCLLMAALLGTHAWSGWKGFRHILKRKLSTLRKRVGSHELAMIIGALAAFGALAVHSIMDFNLHLPANTLLLAWVLGILAAPRAARSLEQEAEGPAPAVNMMRFATPLVALVPLLAGLPLVRGEVFAERARVALRDRAYPEAAEFAKQGITVERQNADLYYYLGEANHFSALMPGSTPDRQVEALENTIQAFEQGLALFPQDLRLLLKLGRTLDSARRFTEAEPIYARALAADPNFNNTHAYYGLHLHLQKHFRSAEIAYRRALHLGRNEIALAGLRDLERDRAVARELAAFDVTDPELEPLDADALAAELGL